MGMPTLDRSDRRRDGSLPRTAAPRFRVARLARVANGPSVKTTASLFAIDPLTGRNRVAASFSMTVRAGADSGPGSACSSNFRGGKSARGGRSSRHLPNREGLRVLEVGIGDGENLPLLPRSWQAYGVDIAPGRLRACLQRFPEMAGPIGARRGGGAAVRGGDVRRRLFHRRIQLFSRPRGGPPRNAASRPSACHNGRGRRDPGPGPVLSSAGSWASSPSIVGASKCSAWIESSSRWSSA